VAPLAWILVEFIAGQNVQCIAFLGLYRKPELQRTLHSRKWRDISCETQEKAKDAKWWALRQKSSGRPPVHCLLGHSPKVTDRTHIFFLEAVRKRSQDSARHHALVHPISPAVGCDGGLPSGGHLFPLAGHLLELHQSNGTKARARLDLDFRNKNGRREILAANSNGKDDDFVGGFSLAIARISSRFIELGPERSDAATRLEEPRKDDLERAVPSYLEYYIEKQKLSLAFLQNTLESFHVLASPEYILVCSTCPEFLSGILPEISICSPDHTRSKGLV
ncbi:putative salivary secreted peptide, partial [Vespula squamosa]